MADDKEKKTKDPVAQANMWGNIASAAASMFQTGAGLVGVLDPKAREAQVAIAQANAQAAGATTPNQQVFGVNPKYLWIGGGALALIIVLLLFKKKQA